MVIAPRSEVLEAPAGTEGAAAHRSFNLLRWYAWVSLAVILSVAAGLGLISSRFIIDESIERDALLTAQFITSIADAEVRHVAIPNVRTMGELLDPRTDRAAMPDVDPEARRKARGEFLDHIAHLPDMLLANIYAPDRTVIWSTNPALVGKLIEGDGDLDRAFEYKMRVSASYHNFEQARAEQKFVTPPQQLLIENYIPLFDADGDTVTAMVEIYKEPRDLIVRIEHGLILIWLANRRCRAGLYRPVRHHAPRRAGDGGAAETLDQQRDLRGPRRGVLGGGPQPAQPTGQHPFQRRVGPGLR